MYNLLKKILPVFILLCCPVLCLGNPQIRIIDARVAEAPPVMEVNAAYLEIENETSSPITLTSVSSDNFSSIKMHRSVIEDGVAKMKPVRTVTIPAHSHLDFKPGGYHLMLFQPMSFLRAGDTVKLTFHFSDGTMIETDAKVVKISQ